MSGSGLARRLQSAKSAGNERRGPRPAIAGAAGAFGRPFTQPAGQCTYVTADGIVAQKPPSTVVIVAAVGATSETPVPRLKVASDAA